ncbi:MAG: hypothetical protein ISS17_03250 [Bacteroidales bacterium]|nr:hypothetical protein [Bacteroidales bacterium]
MKKIFTLVLFFLIVSIGYSQMEISAFNATGGGYSTTFLTDYQCIGVNPANLGWTWNENSMNLGFLETAVGIYSEPLTRKQVWGDLFNESINLDSAGKVLASTDFTDKLLWAQAGVTWFGFSYQHEKIGGFAFTIRDRMLWSTIMNDQASAFLFQGYNASYFDSTANVGTDSVTGYSTNPQMASVVYKGTKLHALWYREYNLGYGRKIMEKEDFTWYGGIALRYITAYGGYQYFEDLSNQKAFSAFSPIFEVNYDEPTPSQITKTGLRRVGGGFGFDLGFTFLIKQKIRIGLAVNDIGWITYNGNVYYGNDVNVYKIETAGIDNYNIFAQGQLIEADNAPGDPSMWVGTAKKKVSLAMNFRGGASYLINDKVEVGIDSYIPLNKDIPGRYEKAMMGVGVHYDPAKWIQLSLGVVTGGKVGTNVPLGITFIPIRKEHTTWQIGFATRDVISFFKSKNPTVSFAFGFLRFSFGELKGGS